MINLHKLIDHNQKTNFPWSSPQVTSQNPRQVTSITEKHGATEIHIVNHTHATQLQSQIRNQNTKHK